MLIPATAHAVANIRVGSVEPKRILLVEDEVLIAMDLEALVLDLGHEIVGPAASCEAALELLRSNHVDAAIVDFVLGDELCHAVAEELTAGGVPWGLSTGYDASGGVERYSEIPLITKPYAAQDVRRVLAELLG